MTFFSKFCPWQSLESCYIDPWAVSERGSPGTPFFSYNSLMLCPCAETSWSSPGLLLGQAAPFHPALFPTLSRRTGLPVSLRQLCSSTLDGLDKQCVLFWGYCKRRHSSWWEIRMCVHSMGGTRHCPVLCLGSCERRCCSEEMGLAGRENQITVMGREICSWLTDAWKKPDFWLLQLFICVDLLPFHKEIFPSLPTPPWCKEGDGGSYALTWQWLFQLVHAKAEEDVHMALTTPDEGPLGYRALL